MLSAKINAKQKGPESRSDKMVAFRLFILPRLDAREGASELPERVVRMALPGHPIGDAAGSVRKNWRRGILRH